MKLIAREKEKQNKKNKTKQNKNYWRKENRYNDFI